MCGVDAFCNSVPAVLIVPRAGAGLGARGESHRCLEEAGLVGEQGPVPTELRPSGSALLEGHPLDVVSEGAFIAKGELVRVISVQGSRVVVRRVEKLPKEAAK